jgi:hypothetical protein
MKKNVCRHSLASFKGGVYSFGGYDGLNVNDMLQSLPLPLPLSLPLPLPLPSSINRMEISPKKTISVPLSTNKSEIQNINQIEIKNRHAISASIVDAKVETLEKAPVKSVPELIPEVCMYTCMYIYIYLYIYLYICIIYICPYIYINIHTYLSRKIYEG